MHATIPKGNSGAPAREARQRSTMGKKIWQTIHLRKFGYDVAYARTLFAGEGRESGVSPSGGGVCYKSRDAFVQPAFFLAGNRARNGVAVVAFKNMFTSAETRPLLLHAHLRR